MSWYQDRFTGVVQNWGAVPRLPHDPEVIAWAGVIPNWGPQNVPLAVGGLSLTQDEAILMALGEVIERCQCRPLPGDGRLLATYADWPMPEQAIDPSRWVLFHPEQWKAGPFRPLTATTPCHWVCCRDLEGEPVWVPEAFVFLEPPLQGRHEGWELFPSLSTGLSAGRGAHPTLLRGLQEVIERDALVGMWWGNYPLVEQDRPPFSSAFLARTQRPNLRYRWFRIETPLAAHVTVVTLEGQDVNGFLFSVGSACRETRLASWEKSTLEAIQGRFYARHLRRNRPQMLQGYPIDFAGHAIYYSLHRDQLALTPFARTVAGGADEAGRFEGLAQLRERVARSILVRVVTPFASDGWRVFRVLVPGLQPLHGHHGWPFLGGPLWGPRSIVEYGRIPPHPFA